MPVVFTLPALQRSRDENQKSWLLVSLACPMVPTGVANAKKRTDFVGMLQKC